MFQYLSQAALSLLLLFLIWMSFSEGLMEQFYTPYQDATLVSACLLVNIEYACIGKRRILCPLKVVDSGPGSLLLRMQRYQVFPAHFQLLMGCPTKMRVK